MKKQILPILLVTALLLTLIPQTTLPVSAEVYSGTCGAEGDGSNLTWTFDSGTDSLIIQGSGEMYSYSWGDLAPWDDLRESIKKVTIGNSVTSIGDWAFSNCTSLTSVTIPDSVTSIGHDAFYNCTSLTSVTIPNSVTSIGDSAFSNCTSLTNVTIPDSVTSIGHDAFYYCTSLTSVTIPNNVTSIGYSAFYYCTSLTSVTIPNSVTSIGGSAFYYCTSLTSVTIPNSVTSIGGSAFSNCTSLTSVTIPNSVTSIGDWAFYNCTSLTRITVASENPNYSSDSSGVLFNKSKTELILCPGGLSGSYTIPNSVTSIGDSAFYNCTSLTSVTIPDSVTSIGHWAFYYCTSLTSVTIPNSVTSIGGSAFSNCTSLTSVTIPDSVTRIGDWAFSNCTSLTSVTIPNSVTSIGGSAFSNCTSLTSVTIPDSVTSIGDEAFLNCSLMSITIPASVTSIGLFTFGFYVDWIDDGPSFVQMPGFSIYGYFGSTAQTYANNNSFDFISLGIDIPDPVPLGDEITHLIFADMAYARIPGKYEGLKSNGEHYTVGDWLRRQDFSTDPKLGYDKKEMTDALFTNSEMNRIQVYSMVGDWEIIDLIDGDKGYAAAVFQKGDQIIIAYRGSEGGPGTVFQGEDWSVDAEFALLNYLDPAQFGAALETYRAYANKGSVTLAGHSLGGALVTYVSTLTGTKGYSFDGAAGHVIDLTYLYEPMSIDFHSKDQMTFTNYTDIKMGSHIGADLIQHTNEDLFPGICYYTNENATKFYNELFWTHQQYSNTIPSNDGTALEFMPLAEEHHPKDNWYVSVDYQYLGIVTGGAVGIISGFFEDSAPGAILSGIKGFSRGNTIGRLIKVGNVHLGTEKDDRISVIDNIKSIKDITAIITENVIYGGDGMDTLIGAAGPDVLVPNGLYWDRLSGGLGDDCYLLDISNTGTVYISDSSGNDTIKVINSGLIRSGDIVAAGYDAVNNSYCFDFGNGRHVYIAKTINTHKYTVVDASGSFWCVIDSHGGINRTRSARGVEEVESKEIFVEGSCQVDVFAPDGSLVTTYNPDQTGLFTEEFGTVYITETDGTRLVDATVCEGYTLKARGEETVDVYIVGTDEDHYVDRVSLAEEVALDKGEVIVIPAEHLVSQGEETVITQDDVKSTSVTISNEGIALDEGKTAELTAKAVFADGSKTADVYWVSSDNSVVTCEPGENGSCVITAVGAGEAEVYAVAEDSGYNAVCTVTVKAKVGFTDVPDDAYYATPVAWAVEHEITNGTSATTFSPNNTCTRAQVVTFLWRARGCPEPTKTDNPFTDVQAGAYYYKAVLWAVEKGITNGTSATTFGPNNGCTRAQVVTFLWRTEGQPEPKTTDNPFTDVTGGYYFKAVLWAAASGVTAGTGATTFSPDNTCTRAQVVTFLYRDVTK